MTLAVTLASAYVGVDFAQSARGAYLVRIATTLRSLPLSERTSWLALFAPLLIRAGLVMALSTAVPLVGVGIVTTWQPYALGALSAGVILSSIATMAIGLLALEIGSRLKIGDWIPMLLFQSLCVLIGTRATLDSIPSPLGPSEAAVDLVTWIYPQSVYSGFLLWVQGGVLPLSTVAATAAVVVALALPFVLPVSTAPYVQDAGPTRAGPRLASVAGIPAEWRVFVILGHMQLRSSAVMFGLLPWVIINLGLAAAPDRAGALKALAAPLLVLPIMLHALLTTTSSPRAAWLMFASPADPYRLTVPVLWTSCIAAGALLIPLIHTTNAFGLASYPGMSIVGTLTMVGVTTQIYAALTARMPYSGDVTGMWGNLFGLFLVGALPAPLAYLIHLGTQLGGMPLAIAVGSVALAVCDLLLRRRLRSAAVHSAFQASA